MARKRSWESEDEELKENTEVGKVVFDNKEVEDDEEVDQGGDLWLDQGGDQGGDLDNLFIEEVEEELEHQGILFQVSVGDMMKQTIYETNDLCYDEQTNFILLHFAYCILHSCNMYIAYCIQHSLSPYGRLRSETLRTLKVQPPKGTKLVH